MSNKHPLIFSTQAWYLGYGARDVLEQACKDLQKKIQVSQPLYFMQHDNWLSFSLMPTLSSHS